MPRTRKVVEPVTLGKYRELTSELNNLSIAIKIHHLDAIPKDSPKALAAAKERIVMPDSKNIISILNKVSAVLSRMLNDSMDAVKTRVLRTLQNDIDQAVFMIESNKMQLKTLPDLLHRAINELDKERENPVKY